MLIRVDTYEGLLSSVDLKLASDQSLIATFSGAAIVDTGGGAYTVDVGANTGEWLLLLKDSTGAVMGIKYASDTTPQAFDFPPWMLSSGGAESFGPYVLTILVEDEDTNPVPGIAVRIVNGAQTTTGQTDITGTVEFTVSAGTWSVLINEAGYTYTTEQVAVADDTIHAATLTTVATVIPADPMLCLVDFYLWGDEAVIVGGKVLATIEDINAVADDYLIAKVKHKATTDENGLAQLQLIRQSAFTSGGVYLIEAFDSSQNLLYTKRVTVPDLEHINATQLIDAG